MTAELWMMNGKLLIKKHYMFENQQMGYYRVEWLLFII